MNRKQSLILYSLMYTALAIASIGLMLNNPEQRPTIIALCIIFILIEYFRFQYFQIDIGRIASLLLIAVQWGIAFIIQVTDGSFLPQVFYFVLIAEVTYRTTRAFSIPFALSCYTGFVLGVITYEGFPPFGEISFVIPRFLEYAIFWAFSDISKTVTIQKDRLMEAHEELKKASLELKEKAMVEERLHLSRDFHDSFGHTLTTSLVGLETSKQLLHIGHHEQAMQQLNQLHIQMKKSLEDVRHSVHNLNKRESFTDIKNNLLLLIQKTMEQANITIEHDISELLSLTDSQSFTIYRALQEGLTNGIRHAHSTHFIFSLDMDDEYIYFELQNNGHMPDDITYGFGMTAMKERVHMLGGDMQLLQRLETTGARLIIQIPIFTHVQNNSMYLGKQSPNESNTISVRH